MTSAQDDLKTIKMLEQALKVIRTWASFMKDSGDTYEGLKDVLGQIAEKADSALKGSE